MSFLIFRASRAGLMVAKATKRLTAGVAANSMWRAIEPALLKRFSIECTGLERHLTAADTEDAYGR